MQQLLIQQPWIEHESPPGTTSPALGKCHYVQIAIMQNVRQRHDSNQTVQWGRKKVFICSQSHYKISISFWIDGIPKQNASKKKSHTLPDPHKKRASHNSEEVKSWGTVNVLTPESWPFSFLPLILPGALLYSIQHWWYWAKLKSCQPCSLGKHSHHIIAHVSKTWRRIRKYMNGKFKTFEFPGTL